MAVADVQRLVDGRGTHLKTLLEERMYLVEEQVDEAGRLAMADLDGQTVADEAQIVLPLQGYGS